MFCVLTYDDEKFEILLYNKQCMCFFEITSNSALYYKFDDIHAAIPCSNTELLSPPNQEGTYLNKKVPMLNNI